MVFALPIPKVISTHAPRTGSDHNKHPHNDGLSRFQPTRPARGATATSVESLAMNIIFQPTRPARGATRRPYSFQHAPNYFNPRSPHGERLEAQVLQRGDGDFNPRSPHGERRVKPRWGRLNQQFQPTLPARGATGTNLPL